MNSFDVMEALGGLPERYYAFCLPGKQEHKSSAGISAPRFITAAAVAACTVFAVAVGAFLIRGRQEEMFLQSNETDSAVHIGVFL